MKLETLQRCLLSALLVFGASGYRAGAAPVTIPDFSFENSTNIPGGSVATSGTNWLATGNGGWLIQNFTNSLFDGTGTLPAPADGTNCFVQNLNGHVGFCWQPIGLLQSNTLYTLTVAVGQSYAGGSGIGKLALVNGTTPFQTILAETEFDSATVTPGTFSDLSLTYVAGYQAGGALTILMQGDVGTQIIYDNVRLDATALPQTPTAVVPALSPPSSTVYKGTLVTLSESPAGAAPFDYQWQTDNGSAGAAFSDIAGANSATCAVDTSGFAVGAAVQYRVVVTNNLGQSTSAPVTLSIIEGQPVIVRETLPVTAYTMVGDQVSFSVQVDGSRPLGYQWLVDTGAGLTPIPDATNATLTIRNLQLADAGSYSLQVTNEFGSANSSAAVLAVDPPVADANGVVVALAAQTGLGGTNLFTPTWVVATNSLIGGLAPSSSVGNFGLERAGGIPILTDGRYGILPPGGNASADLATCGRSSAGAGSSITYTLPASTTGYDLTNVVVYGGWSDAGRDQQQYNLYYSTVANPSNFNNLIAYVNFQPTNTANAQSATRVTLTGTNGVVARNVAAIMFDFNVLVAATENEYTGYGEFQVFGVPSAPKPVLSVDTQPTTASDVEGSQMIFTAAFTSSTPMTYQWQVDSGTGAVDIAGATNATLVLSNLQLSNSGAYSLKASNASGTSVSRSSTLVVNALPAPDGYGVIVCPANQTGTGTKFTPTWTFPSGNLIANSLPSRKGSGTFYLEGATGLVVLTDGQFGSVGSGKNGTLATCGSGTNPGRSVTYVLTGSSTGYDLTSVVVYAGWSDGGRDEQAYTVYYSTIAAPDSFSPLTSLSYNPTLPGAVPSADRVTLLPSSSALASGVAKIMFDFTSPAGENGYSGYAEIAVFGSPSTGGTVPPTVVNDTLPATGSDVVGGQVTFNAAIGSSQPMTYQWRRNTGSGDQDIPGATNASLTLVNLQLTDSGSYMLVASNELGVATSSAATFTVSAVPAPSGGVVIALANQTSFSNSFTPTWTIEPGSLIAGAAPSTVGSGSFVLETSGGVPMLTDGAFGSVGAGSYSFASCGVGAGTTLTYTLPVSATGYDLTKIITYGGWADAGRDQQHYTVYYSTVANPTTFTKIASASYNPSNPSSSPSADRVVITPETGVLARNAAAVRFTFTTPTGENGWSGYSELSLFGVASPPSVGSTVISGGNLIVTGAGGRPGGSFACLTSTNVAAPLAEWTTNNTGMFSSSGTFSNAIPWNASEPVRFFRLKTP